MTDNKTFWNKWAKRYDCAMSGDGKMYAQIAGRIKKKLNRGMTVPELACGMGMLSVELPYAPESFDAVVISNAIHIMPYPEKALSEIKRVLKKTEF